MATLCTTEWTLKIVRSAQKKQLHVLYGSQTRAVTSPYNINLLVFITETERVHCEVRAEFLNIIYIFLIFTGLNYLWMRIYEGHLESKERFAIKKYLLIIGKKKNMQVLSHNFTYFST